MWFWFMLLSTMCWAVVNVLDSILVAHYDKRPFVLQWHQSLFTLSSISILALTHQVGSAWSFPLLLAGVCAYAGDWVFFIILGRIDASVSNIAWAILSLFLGVGGYFLYGETWTSLNFFGAALILTGVIFLSVWQRTVTHSSSLWLLPLLALLNVPFYLVQKAAVLSGESVFLTFFWLILGREMLAGSVPLLIPKLRRQVLHVFTVQPLSFPILNFFVIALFFSAVTLVAKALSMGPVSLVSIVGNVQPFLVLSVGWVVWRLKPAYASRELFTAQSVTVKITAFLIVFCGLALLAISQ